MQRNDSGTGWIAVGAVLGGLAVALGALAAHGLDRYLVDKYAGVQKTVAGESVAGAKKYLGDFKTAAEYQMVHALALVLLGSVGGRLNSRLTAVAGWCFLGGTVLFSGSLYCLVLSGRTWLGAITPFGGVLFIVGWWALAWSAWSSEKPGSSAAVA